MSVVRFGLGFAMMQFQFCTSHVHAYFMHTYSFLSVVLVVMCVCVCVCVFFFRIDCVWHLSANLLWLRTLLVPSLLLLILPFPLFTFGFVMGRLNRTSLRTFRNVAFIWSVMLSCRTFLTLFYPVSFGLEDEILYVRNPWGVLSCLYRSFTPIYTVSIPLYLCLPRNFEVHVS